MNSAGINIEKGSKNTLLEKDIRRRPEKALMILMKLEKSCNERKRLANSINKIAFKKQGKLHHKLLN